jgi:hypothetical protein
MSGWARGYPSRSMQVTKVAPVRSGATYRRHLDQQPLRPLRHTALDSVPLGRGFCAHRSPLTAHRSASGRGIGAIGAKPCPEVMRWP